MSSSQASVYVWHLVSLMQTRKYSCQSSAVIELKFAKVIVRISADTRP